MLSFCANIGSDWERRLVSCMVFAFLLKMSVSPIIAQAEIEPKWCPEDVVVTENAGCTWIRACASKWTNTVYISQDGGCGVAQKLCLGWWSAGHKVGLMAEWWGVPPSRTAAKNRSRNIDERECMSELFPSLVPWLIDVELDLRGFSVSPGELSIIRMNNIMGCNDPSIGWLERIHCITLSEQSYLIHQGLPCPQLGYYPACTDTLLACK